MAARKRTPQAVHKPRTSAPSSDKIAKAAVGNEGEPSRSGEVALTLRITLSHAQAERLTARAIRDGKNRNALVGEILEDALTEATE
jgi:hypothetical protein